MTEGMLNLLTLGSLGNPPRPKDFDTVIHPTRLNPKDILLRGGWGE